MTEEDLKPHWQRRDGHRRFHLKSLCANDQQTWPQAKIFCWCYMQNGTRTASVRTRDSMHISDKASLYPGDSGQQFNILESKFKTHLGHWYLNAYLNFPTFVSDCDFYKLWCWHNDNFLSIMLKTVSIIFYHQWWELCHNKQSNIISIQIFFNLKYFLWCTT